MKNILISVFALATILATSCEPSVNMFDCDGSTPTYTADIKAIIDASCATSGCHDATTMADGRDLTTYAKVSTDSKNSNFLGSIQQLDQYTAMPIGSPKLSDAQIETISCWVQGGSPE